MGRAPSRHWTNVIAKELHIVTVSSPDHLGEKGASLAGVGGCIGFTDNDLIAFVKSIG
jgi:hypothetical protein